MRILPDFPDWRDQYIVDVQTAENELMKNGLISRHDEPIVDIYSLPAHHHQTFLVKLAADHDIFKLVYAKPIQHSVWFSDPIYMYTFDEADRFRDDPKRKGQIICGVKIVDEAFVGKLAEFVSRISTNQPASAVKPDAEADLTAIRIYSAGRVSSEYLYTDASLLELSEDCNAEETTAALDRLHLAIEEIIGKGEDHPEPNELHLDHDRKEENS